MRKIFLLSAVIIAVFVVTSGHSVRKSFGDEGALDSDYSTFVTRAQLEAALQSVVPCGTIIMWYHPSFIPPGWAICNGENDTPDLRDRFVVSAGYNYKLGDVGGVAHVALDIDELPRHVHGTADVTADLSLGTKPNTQFLVPTSEIDTQEGLGAWTGAKYTDLTTIPPISIDIDVHGHVDATGMGRPHENRPPYVALSFIMKLCEELE